MTLSAKIKSELIGARMLDCCKRSYVRGLFVACGTLSVPADIDGEHASVIERKGYHLDLTLQSKAIADSAATLLASFRINMKYAETGGRFRLYLKDREAISDFLALVGSVTGVTAIQDIILSRELRNDTNRAINCNNANTDKITVAAAKRTLAFKDIAESKEFSSLPPDLRQTVTLCLNNPDLSLDELKDQFVPPVTKSCLNHRIRKLLSLATDKNN